MRTRRRDSTKYSSSLSSCAVVGSGNITNEDLRNYRSLRGSGRGYCRNTVATEWCSYIVCRCRVPGVNGCNHCTALRTGRRDRAKRGPGLGTGAVVGSSHVANIDLRNHCPFCGSGRGHRRNAVASVRSRHIICRRCIPGVNGCNHRTALRTRRRNCAEGSSGLLFTTIVRGCHITDKHLRNDRSLRRSSWRYGRDAITAILGVNKSGNRIITRRDRGCRRR